MSVLGTSVWLLQCYRLPHILSSLRMFLFALFLVFSKNVSVCLVISRKREIIKRKFLLVLLCFQNNCSFPMCILVLAIFIKASLLCLELCNFLFVYFFTCAEYLGCFSVSVSFILFSLSWSKKEMEKFIRAKLRIITWEQPLRNPWELFLPLEVKTQFCLSFLRLDDALLTAYTIGELWVMGHLGPYKIKKECGTSWRSSGLRLWPSSAGGMGSSKPSGMTKKKKGRNVVLKELSSVLESVALYGWAGISASGQVWLLLNWDTHCTVEGREEAKGQRDSV